LKELFDPAGDSYETKFVSYAVINLYAAHVHSLFHRHDHPLVSDSLKNAFHGLEKVLRKKPHLHLETAGGRLMVDGEALTGDVLILGHFASWLNSMNIKTLSFARDLTRREVIAFHKIVSGKKMTAGELSKEMVEKSVINITIEPLELSADRVGAAFPDNIVRRGLIEDYENTMYHAESSQAHSPFFNRPIGIDPNEDAAGYGFIKDRENRVYQPERPSGLTRFDMDSHGKSSAEEMSKADRYEECVTALLDHDISGEDQSIVKEIPPPEIAHLLNTMLFSVPDGEVVDRIIRTCFGKAEEIQGEALVERFRIFLTGLKASFRPLFLSRFAFLFSGDTLIAKQGADILREEFQEAGKPTGTEDNVDSHPEQTASAICRTIEGSDFPFDFVTGGGAVLHDIEIPGETAGLFNEAHIAHFEKEGVLDALSSSVRSADGGMEFQAAIIGECTEEAIAEAFFDVVVEILMSDSVYDDVYRKLEARLTALAEFLSEKGELDKVLELFNSLKTQSLQGNRSVAASVMIRRVFSSDKVNAKVVEALRQYGRTRRDTAYQLTNGLRSFVVPHLLDALSEESNTSTRRFIMSLVTSVGSSETVDHIAKRLHDGSWYVVRNMLYLLRECKGRNHIRAVRSFLEHKEPLVCLEALRTLLSFQDPEAGAHLKKFLRSDELQLQNGAVRLAGAYRIKYAVPHLVRLLREKDIAGKGFHFGKRIVRALGRIGDSRALRHFLNVCDSTSGPHKDGSEKLKVEIFKTLHNYPAAAIRPLIEYGLHSTNKEIAAISRQLADRCGLVGRKAEIKK
jgi:HEAT repeat protein